MQSFLFAFSIVTFFLVFLSNYNVKCMDEETLNMRMNISQEEYLTMTRDYLQRHDPNSEIFIKTAYGGEREWQENGVRLNFDVSELLHINSSRVHSVHLKMLSPSIDTGSTSVLVKLFDPKDYAVRDSHTVYLSTKDYKWIDIDVTNILRPLFGNGENTWSIHIIDFPVIPSRAFLNMIIQRDGVRRKREAPKSRLDCSTNKGPYKGQCCRKTIGMDLATLKSMHKQEFDMFKNVQLPHMIYFSYCIGLCDSHTLMRANHTHFKYFIKEHIEYKNYCDENVRNQDEEPTMITARLKRIPQICCIPAVYDRTTVLKPDSNNPNKLKLEDIENLIVTECKCA